MVYEVRIHREPLKAYRKLDRELQAKVDEAIEDGAIWTSRNFTANTQDTTD